MSTQETSPNSEPKQKMPKGDRRCIAIGLAAVAVFGAYCGFTKLQINKQKEQAEIEYVQKFDRQNFFLSTLDDEGFEQLPGAIPDESFAQIPKYEEGDDLTSPRVYNFKLDAETCKTFKVDDVEYKDIRVAVNYSEPYPRGSNFGIITNIGSFSLCRTNPTPYTTPDGEAVAHIDLAIQATVPGSKLNRDW